MENHDNYISVRGKVTEIYEGFKEFGKNNYLIGLELFFTAPKGELIDMQAFSFRMNVPETVYNHAKSVLQNSHNRGLVLKEGKLEIEARSKSK